MSLRQLVQIKRDPPNLLGTSHQPAHEERTEIMASAYTTPIHRFSFRVEYKRYVIFSRHTIFTCSTTTSLKHHHFASVDNTEHLTSSREVLQFSTYYVSHLVVPSTRYILRQDCLYLCAISRLLRS